MKFELVSSLSSNILLVFALGALMALIHIHLGERQQKTLHTVALAALFTITTALSMALPIVVAEGVLQDVRVPLLTLAGAFGGPWVALPAALLAGSIRTISGGVGLWAGLTEVIGATLLGLAIWSWRRNWFAEKTVSTLLWASLGIIIVENLAFAALPPEIWPHAIHMHLIVTVLMPLSFLLLSAFLIRERNIRLIRANLARREELLRLSLTGTSTALIQLHPHTSEGNLWLTAQALDDETSSTSNWKHLIHQDDHQSIYEALERVRQGATEVRATVRYLDNGSPRWAHLRGSATPHTPYILGVLVDIDDRVRLEEELRQFNGELEDLVHLRTSELAATNEELEAMNTSLQIARDQATEASAAKSLFLAQMSHEIRTPMNAVIGLARLLEKTPMDSTQSNYLLKLRQAAETLLQLLNDILDFSKIEAGKMTIESVPFETRQIFESLSAISENSALHKGILFELNIDPSVPRWALGDPLRLTQILLNLTSNAVKFTDKGGIRICISASESNDQTFRLHFNVADTGIGIPPEQMNKLFETFQQADRTISRRYGGTGLGLSIARELAIAMNGDIVAQSVHGQGTTMSGHILLHHSEGLEPDAYQSCPLQQKHILIVDDEEVNRLIAVELLKSYGHICTTATNGKEAFDIVRKAGAPSFDAILMDVQMPEWDGITSTKAIRQLPDAESLQIIALSADALEETIRDAKSAGMNDFMCKPFDPDAMQRLLCTERDKTMRI